MLLSWTVESAALAMLAATAVIGVFGTRLVRVAEQLSAQTRLGQAVFGAVLLGGVTSLPGIVASVAAAIEGDAPLAVSNAVGGIAAQTVFLVIADFAYRRANLEHAAASLANITWGAVVIALMSVAMCATIAPALTVAGVHPASLVLALGYLGGVQLSTSAQRSPMWAPAETPETMADALPSRRPPYRQPWAQFAVAAVAVASAGLVLADAGGHLAKATPLSSSTVGAFFTAVSTSLPELITAVVAVRRGALALAVGDILGGNAFDVLFLAAADVAWRDGSIFHAVGKSELYLLAVTILMTAVLLLGLVRRQKHGIGNVGFEGVLVLAIYVLSAVHLTAGR